MWIRFYLTCIVSSALLICNFTVSLSKTIILLDLCYRFEIDFKICSIPSYSSCKARSSLYSDKLSFLLSRSYTWGIWSIKTAWDSNFWCMGSLFLGDISSRIYCSIAASTYCFMCCIVTYCTVVVLDSAFDFTGYLLPIVFFF